MKTAIDQIKELDIEVRQWQGRLDFAKSENSRLLRESDELKKEAELLRAAATAHAEKERALVRIEMNKLTETRTILTSQKEEFAAVLSAFKREKELFEKERQSAIDAKANYEKMTERVGAFVLTVKRESERL